MGAAGGRCGACLLDPPAHDGARACVLYRGAARRFLLRAKSGRRELLPYLASHLCRVLQTGDFAAGCTCVCFVPSHPLRWLRRGFNPAAELAVPLAGALRLPVRRFALWRSPADLTASKQLGAGARRRQGGRFAPLRRMDGHHVLLVDDVMTTGATAAACAAALRAGGAATVRIAVWARTPPPDRSGRFDRRREPLL